MKREIKTINIQVILIAVFIFSSTTNSAVYYVSPSGDNSNPGTFAAPFKTIQKGADTAQAGDEIVVRAGTYRERVMPPRGGEDEQSRITYRVYPGEEAIITGLDIFSGKWTHEGGNVYSTTPPASLFKDTAYLDGGNPYTIGYASRIKGWEEGSTLSLGHLVVDGIMWTEKGKKEHMQAEAATWWCDLSTGTIYANFPGTQPDTHTIEITTRRGVFRPYKVGLGYITVSGFTMEYCANQFPKQFWKNNLNAQSGLMGTRKGHHWVIEYNTIRYAKSIGLTIGQDSDNEIPEQTLPDTADVGYHVIRHNTFTLNGCGGIMGLGHHHVQVIGNKFTFNNYLLVKSPEKGGMKSHFVYHANIANNLFELNDCHGLWLDNTIPNCRVTGNLFINNRGQNIMLEMEDSGEGKETIVDNNVLIGCRLAVHEPHEGLNRHVGHYSHDASHYLLVNNLIMDMPQLGIFMRDSSDRRGECHRNQVYNNLLVNNTHQINIPVDSDQSYENKSEHNVFAAKDPSFIMGTYTDDTKDRAWGMESILAVWQQSGSPEPNLSGKEWPDNNLKSGYQLTLDQWRAMTGRDIQSQSTQGISADFDFDTYTLILSVDESPWNVGHKAVEGVDKDYFGNTIGPEAAVGPFQNLKAGINRLTLWDEEVLTPKHATQD